MQLKLSIFVICYLFSASSYSQNLVSNSSFEDFYTCDGRTLPETPYGWYRVAKSGAGFYPNIPGSTGKRNLECIIGSNYRELRTYWETILLQKLQKGKRYKINMSVASTFYEGPNLNDIGFYFIDSLIVTASIDTLLQPSRYVGFLDSKVKVHKNYWFRIEKEFIAEGNNQVLVIGNFSGKDYQKIVTNRNRNSKYLSIHIDDIGITPMEKASCVECEKIKDSLYLVSKIQTCSVQSPKINDTIAVRVIKPRIDTVLIDADILFASNSFAIAEPDSLEFIRKVFNFKNIAKIKIVGFTDDVGTEEYNRELSLKRAQSIKSFIQNKFQISSLIIEVEGQGISTKYSDKKLNRRVEIIMFEK